MSPRTTVQFEKIREEKKKIILETALELFANKGYHATSISDIAKNAKISKGLMYNYFENKVALLKAMIIEANRLIWSHFDPNQDGILTKEEFLYFIHQNFKIAKENLYQFKLYTSLMIQSEVFEIIREDFSITETDYIRMLQSFFTNCGCKDPEGELLIFASLIKGAIVQYVSAPQYFSVDLFEEKIIEFYKDRINIK